MNELKVFNEQEIFNKYFRIFGTPENPLFLVKDVAEWIEYNISKVSRLVENIDENEKVRHYVSTLGGLQETWFVTEDGLLEILMQSRKPIAKQFKKKVKEILKNIRKHGVYMTPSIIEETLNNPDFIIKLATELKQEKEKRLEIENHLKLCKEKVEVYDQVMDSNGLLNFIQVADVFGDCGRNTLMKILREENILMNGEITKNVPYSQYIKNGYFEVVVRPRKTKDGIQDITTTLCKPKALKLIKKVLDKKKTAVSS